MSGVYTVTLAPTALAAVADIFALVAAASKPIAILGFGLFQITDFGDAQDEVLHIRIRSGQTTVGSGGSAGTAVNNEPGSGSAASFTSRTLDTTQASAGTILIHRSVGWNVRAPLDVVFTEAEQLLMAVSRRCTIELAAAPADSITIGGYVTVQEIG